MKLGFTVKRYQHTFNVYPEGERWRVRVKPVRREAFMLDNSLGGSPHFGTTHFASSDEAQAGIREYCKIHSIPFTKPTERDETKAGTASDWSRIAEELAGVAAAPDAALEVLGLTAMPATQDALKKAYRKASLKAHPDHGGSDDLQRQVTEAYNTLKRSIS